MSDTGCSTFPIASKEIKVVEKEKKRRKKKGENRSLHLQNCCRLLH